MGDARVVVALRSRREGDVYRGLEHEQHHDLRTRLNLGRVTEGWLDAGFVDLDTGEWLDRGDAARRWPDETDGQRADSSDFKCIIKARAKR